MTSYIRHIWHFYRTGFREMTWGRTLWVLILIKLFIIFIILRLFFFQPRLKGMTETEKSEVVATELCGDTATMQPHLPATKTETP